MAVSIEQVRSAGVVGAGGGGFPTHVKLAGRADTVLLNAAECEPLLHKDKEVLRQYAEKVLAGLSAAMTLTGAARGIVGIKEKYDDVISQLRPVLPAGVEIFPLRDAYPAGDEFVLVYDALGRVIPPGGIPLHVNAVVMNVETALNVAAAGRTPVVEKFVSVAGAVANPVTLRVPVGVTLAQCVNGAGGATCADAVYVVGGVMMGRLEDDHYALVDKTTGGIIVLPEGHVVIRRRRNTYAQLARIGRSGCDQCSFCTELCPRYLLGHPIEPHRAMRSLMFNLVGQPNVRGTSFCCECNLCSMFSCPEDLDPKNVCGENKRRIAAERSVWKDPPFNPRPAWPADGRSKSPDRQADAQARPGGLRKRRPAGRRPAVGPAGGHQAEAAHRRPVSADGERRSESDGWPAGRSPADGRWQARAGRSGSRVDRRERDGHQRRSDLDRESLTFPLVGGSTMGVRWESQARLFGVPLVSVACGPDPAKGEVRGRAKGIIAIGDIATGGVAVGGVSCGGIAIGGVAAGAVTVSGVALGGIALGGLAVGIAAIGGLAVGAWALGGLAIGWWATGGLAIGKWVAGGLPIRLF